MYLTSHNFAYVKYKEVLKIFTTLTSKAKDIYYRYLKSHTFNMLNKLNKLYFIVNCHKLTTKGYKV